MIVLIYILKMLSCSAVLSGYYYFFLRNRSFHQYNRFFLLMIFLSSLLLPFVRLPFLSFGSNEAMPVFKALSPELLPEVVLTFNREASLERISMPDVFILIYVVVVLALLFRVMHSLIYIIRLSKQFPHSDLGKFKMFFTNEPGTPFSFFNWIFWNNKLDAGSISGRRVLQHELYHIREKHSADMLFVECIVAICWFNPFFYFLRKELKTIHEFLADKAALNGTDSNEYAELLLMHAIAEKQRQLVHPFFHNQIKRRIIMITQINKTRFAFVRRVMSVPLMFVVCLACSRGIDDANNEAAASAAAENQMNSAQAFQRRDTVRIMAAQLERLFIANAETLNISSNTVGDKTYMTFDSGPVYSLPTAEMQAWQAGRPAGKARIPSGKRNNYTDYNQTFTKVEIEADYPGGVDAWMRFLNKNFNYPQEAVEKEIQGTVVLQFIVEKDGTLSESQAITGPEVLRTEALRVINKTGKWLPALQDGVPVRSYKKQPITFRLQSE